MRTFAPQNVDFESAVRESFDRLTLMRTIGATLERVSPGEVDIALPFRTDLTQHHGFMAAAVLTAHPKKEVPAMQVIKAPFGERMVQLKVKFWTDHISPRKGTIAARHIHEHGVVEIDANTSHGIAHQRPEMFNSLAQLPAAIERALIKAGITVHVTRSAKYMVVPRAATRRRMQAGRSR